MRLKRLFKEVHLTTFQKKELSRYIDELSAMGKEKKVHDELKRIIERKNLSPREKGELLYHKIFSLRYPKLSSAMKRFQKISNRIYRSVGIKVSHSKSFEGGFKVDFSFSTREEFFKIIERIKEKYDEIKDLFNFFA